MSIWYILSDIMTMLTNRHACTLVGSNLFRRNIGSSCNYKYGKMEAEVTVGKTNVYKEIFMRSKDRFKARLYLELDKQILCQKNHLVHPVSYKISHL